MKTLSFLHPKRPGKPMELKNYQKRKHIKSGFFSFTELLSFAETLAFKESLILFWIYMRNLTTQFQTEAKDLDKVIVHSIYYFISVSS